MTEAITFSPPALEPVTIEQLKRELDELISPYIPAIPYVSSMIFVGEPLLIVDQLVRSQGGMPGSTGTGSPA